MNRKVKKTFPAIGRLQLFALESVESAVCSECGKPKTSKKWAVLDGDWNHRMCNGCYGQILATEGHPYLERNTP